MQRIKYLLIFVLISLVSLNAQINSIRLTNTEKIVQIDAGKRVKITTNENVKLKGKISYFVNDTVLYLIAEKDTVNVADVKEIKVYNKGTRIAGNIVAGAGGASTLLGVAMVVGASTELGQPGSWADLGMIIGGIYTVGSAAISGVGFLVSSIGKTYQLNQWKIEYVR